MSQSLYMLGAAHAKEMLDRMAEANAVPSGPLYLDREEVAPGWGYYSWNQYLKGARSVLGETRVRETGTEGATPAVFG